jgi:hypothetical protein
MAKSNAELQQAYRRRSELVRLDIRIDGMAKRALARLAAYQATTQSSTLSELILKAERDVQDTLDDAAKAGYATGSVPVKTITG